MIRMGWEFYGGKILALAGQEGYNTKIQIVAGYPVR